MAIVDSDDFKSKIKNDGWGRAGNKKTRNLTHSFHIKSDGELVSGHLI